MAWLTVPLMAEKTPMAFMTIHSTATATIVQTPSAIDSRKLTFITDHGSAFATRSRALRVRGTVRAPGARPAHGASHVHTRTRVGA